MVQGLAQPSSPIALSVGLRSLHSPALHWLSLDALLRKGIKFK